jgi:lipopolysaccharide assembly outer membrane protein LptD (OstA)
MRRILLVLGVLCSPVFLAAVEPRTIITGEEMEILKGGQTVLFSGGARVTRGENVLTADRLRQDKKTNRVEAEGRVNFKSYTQERELVLGRSERALYLPADEKGELWEGRPEIQYYAKTSTAPLQLEADRIRFDQKTEEIQASGTVTIVSSSATAHAPEAVFRQRDKTVVLNGTAPQPRVRYLGEKGVSTYQADRITVYIDRKRTFLEGNVHVRVESEELKR